MVMVTLFFQFLPSLPPEQREHELQLLIESDRE
jgi:hypothetical protein